jgi:RimJ/RimL family protein N-acetyltransferase
MRLVAGTARMMRAEIAYRATLAELLGAEIPDDWPPDEMLTDALPYFLDRLDADPQNVGWLLWYGIATGTPPGTPDVLVASGGFIGPPEDGAVEIGYSVVPSRRGRGYATEMVTALVQQAFADRRVARVIADARPENTPSVRLLTRLGFTAVGPGEDPGYIRYARERQG